MKTTFIRSASTPEMFFTKPDAVLKNTLSSPNSYLSILFLFLFLVTPPNPTSKYKCMHFRHAFYLNDILSDLQNTTSNLCSEKKSIEKLKQDLY